MSSYSGLNHSRSHFSKHLDEKKYSKLENKSMFNILVTMNMKKIYLTEVHKFAQNKHKDIGYINVRTTLEMT